MTDADLKTLIQTDPAQIGFAQMSHAQMVDAFNDPAGKGAGQVTLASMSRDEFLTGILPGTQRLATLSAAIQSKWDRMLSVACAANIISMPAVSAILAAAVTDGVMLQAEVDPIGKRQGSYLEVLEGAGSVMTLDRIVRTLGTNVVILSE